MPKVLGDFPGGVNGFRRRFERAGLEVCCLDSSVVLSNEDASISEGERMIELAMGLGAPYVRVFGGGVPEGESLAELPSPATDRMGDHALQHTTASVIGSAGIELF